MLSYFEMLEMNSLFIWGLPSIVVPGDWEKGAGNPSAYSGLLSHSHVNHIFFHDAH